MVNTNGMNVIFKIRLLQHTFNQNKLLIKCINQENIINHLSTYPWFSTPGGLGSFPSFWKHIYSLLTGGNLVVVCKFKIFCDVVAIRCAWWLGVEVVVMLWFFFLMYHKTLCRRYLWCLHHYEWNFGNTKKNCSNFCL